LAGGVRTDGERGGLLVDVAHQVIDLAVLFRIKTQQAFLIRQPPGLRDRVQPNAAGAAFGYIVEHPADLIIHAHIQIEIPFAERTLIDVLAQIDLHLIGADGAGGHDGRAGFIAHRHQRIRQRSHHIVRPVGKPQACGHLSEKHIAGVAAIGGERGS